MSNVILKNGQPTISRMLKMLNKSHFLLSILLFMFASLPLCAQEIQDALTEDVIEEIQLPYHPDYDWVSYRMKLNATIEGSSQSFQSFFVNRIDSIIYLNANVFGIELFRIVMTPDALTFLDRVNSQYYQGDYQFLTKWLGFPVSFYMFQAIFNGLDFTEFEQNHQIVEQETGVSYIAPQRCHLVENLFCISQQIDLDNSAHIVRNQFEITQLSRSMIVFYEQYAMQNLRDFFTFLRVEIPHLGISGSTDIKSLKFNESGPTSIKIPSNYTPIKLPEE